MYVHSEATADASAARAERFTAGAFLPVKWFAARSPALLPAALAPADDIMVRAAAAVAVIPMTFVVLLVPDMKTKAPLRRVTVDCV